MCRENSDVNDLKETAAVAYHTAHADDSIRGGGLEDLDCKKSIREADSRSLYGLWGEGSGSAERDVVLNAGCGMDYGVVSHDDRLGYMYSSFGSNAAESLRSRQEEQVVVSIYARVIPINQNAVDPAGITVRSACEILVSASNSPNPTFGRWPSSKWKARRVPRNDFRA